MEPSKHTRGGGGKGYVKLSGTLQIVAHTFKEVVRAG